MEVRIFPNLRRPGVGLKPRREAQRPLLPQHARHCPVLEAGSALGFLCYPALEPHESFHVGYDGEGHYRFVYYVKPANGKWEAMFSVAISLPVGGFGVSKEEVTFVPGKPASSPDVAQKIMRRFFVPEDLNTPAGAVTLRGAWNFQTPAGWDTVYVPVFNAIERPVVPMMVIRVETDWYAHESEFRYVLQPGEAMSVEHSMPIGQAFFVPREPITLRECTEAEVTAIHESQGEFQRQKAAATQTTPYGLPFSPHYLRKSREQSSGRQGPPEGAEEAVTPPFHRSEDDVSAAPGKVGRNDPCPCGSGKKYKKCHGEGG